MAGAFVVGQQAWGDGLVGDEGADLFGVPHDRVHADDGSEAAAEHEGGGVGERGQQAVDVVGVLGQCRASLGASSRLRDSPRRS
ncbi:hypothetical protein SAV14893_088720 [Streptomyces avermitilis]|uniref:Uncharacterized protein n=1 Tax=Streptomyces avermitilis TaxID=33903 RepID=A0A4D4MCZ1_STRAX|nr:hypothetical protein SAV14893_088720 [Streptomyces avermitilis]